MMDKTQFQYRPYGETMTVDIGQHIYAHNQMLRQLIDSAELSSDPRMPVFKPSYEIEVDFND